MHNLQRILCALLFTSPFLLFSGQAGAQVTAGFTANPVSGCSPLAVSFTNTSTGSNLRFTWDLGNGNNSTLTNPGAIYNAPGSYTVTLIATDTVGGSSDTLTQTGLITVFANPGAGFTVNQASGCAPLTVAFTDTSLAGSSAITNWLWDFGDGNISTQQNPTHTYTSLGSFTVTLVVTDANGCTGNIQLSNFVNTSTQPVPAFTATNRFGCTPPHTVNFTNTSTGGAAPLTYSWDFGDGNTSTATNPSHTYNVGGTFNVRLIVTDVNGCADTLTQNSFVRIASPTASFSSNDTLVCEGDPVTFINTTTGTTGGTTWLWDFGDGNTSNAQNPTHSYAAPGDYTVSLTVTSGPGCTDTFTRLLYITVNPIPTANFTGNPLTSCSAPLNVTFTDNSTNAATYAWDFGDGNNSTAQNPSHTYTAPGSYTVVLTVTSPDGCTNTFTRNNYVVIDPPVANFDGVPQTGCAPLLTTFTSTSTSTADPIVSYEWIFGDGNTLGPVPAPGGANVANNYLLAGTYTVTLIIVTATGCRDTLIRPNYIQVGDVPFASFTAAPTTVCFGDTVNFTSLSTPPGVAHNYDFGDGGNSNQPNPQYVYGDTGVYTVTLTVSDNGCTDDTVVTNLITVSGPIADFNFTPNVGCDTPQVVSFTDQSAAPDTWFWNFGNGSTSTLQNPLTTYDSAGTFYIRLTVTDTITGCVDSLLDSILIVVPEANFTVTNDSGCVPLTASFTNTSNPVGVFFQWDFGDGGTSNQQNPNHTYNTPGVYDVRLIMQDANGCRDTLVQTSLINARGPSGGFFADTLVGCPGLVVSFTDTSSSTSPIVSWVWDFGDGNSAFVPNPTHTYNSTGNFQVRLTVTDGEGCVRTFTRNNYIRVTFPNPNFTASQTFACPDNTINFNNLSGGVGLSYFWNFGDGTTTTASNPSHQYTADGSYRVVLTVTDLNGCVDSIADTINVVSPVAGFTTTGTSATCPPFLVTFTDTSSNAVAWEWDFGDGTTSTLQNPSKIYTVPGSFNVTLIVTGPNGCTDTLFLPNFVTVQGPTGSFVFAPDSGCTPQMVTFEATAVGAISYTWDFGDGTIFIGGDSVTHTYNRSGVFHPVVLLEDAGGCVFPITTPDSIIIDTIPTVNFTADTTVLCGPGTINFTDQSTGPYPSVAWLWDFGDGNTSTLQNPSHAYAATGVYTVTLTVTQATGCVNTLVRPNYIYIVDPPTANFGLDTLVGCTPFSVTFTDSSTATFPLVNFAWDFGDGNTGSGDSVVNVFTTAVDTNYLVQLIVTDSLGCQDTTTGSVQVNIGPRANFVASPDSFFCPADVVTLVADSGMGIVNWAWDYGDTTSSNSGNSTVTHTYVNPDTGLFTVVLTVTDTLGCMDTLTKPNYIDITPPQAAFTVDTAQGCPGTTINFTDATQSNTGGATFAWDFGDGNSGSGATASNTYGAPGTYVVRLTVTDSLGCTGIATDTITIFTPPFAGFRADSIVGCTPFAVNFQDTSVSNSAPVNAWAWDFGNGNTGALPNITEIFTTPVDTTYQVTLIVTDTLGCMDTVSSGIQVNVGPTAYFVAAPDSFLCPLDTVTFNSVNRFGTVLWNWSFGDTTNGTSATPSIQHVYTSPDTGMFTVTLEVTDTLGCRDTLTKTDYIIISPPVPSFVADTLNGCPGTTIRFQSTSQADTVITNVAWDFGDGNSGTGDTISHTYGTPGTYTVTLTITDSLGCSESTTQTVTIFTPPVAGFVPDSIVGCTPFLVTFRDTSVSNSAPVNVWAWDFGDGNTASGDSVTNLFMTSRDTNFTVTLIVTDSLACMDTTSQNIQLNIGPMASFVAQPDSFLCPQDTLTLLGGSGMGIVTWNWDFGDTTTGSDTVPSIQHVFTTPDTGTYSITLEVIDTLGCRDTLLKPNYIVISPPIVRFTADTLNGCPGTTFTFVDSTQTDTLISRWDWDFGDGNSGVGDSVLHTYSAPGNYTVTLTVTDSLGCTNSFSRVVTIWTPPVASFELSDTLGCEPLFIQFSDSSQGQSASIFTWNWDYGDGNGDTINRPRNPNVSHTYFTNGNQVITLIVTDSLSCADTTTRNLFINPQPTANFISPDTLQCFPDSVAFTDLSTGGVNSWLWGFGDGNTSNDQNPVHAYGSLGPFDVLLVVTDTNGCMDTLDRPQYVQLFDPVANFVVDTTGGCLPLSVVFTDSSRDDTTLVSYQWNFGDGNTGSGTPVGHTYTGYGTYGVQLVITNAVGCTDSLFRPDLITLIEPVPPQIHFTTVIDNQGTELHYETSTEPDFDRYVIWRESPVGSGTFIRIDSLTNLSDTIYADNGLDTRNNSYCYRVTIADQCAEQSALDSSRTHCTIETDALPGVDLAMLTWNPYVGWDSVANYNIYRASDYSAGGLRLIGTVPGNQTSFIDTNAICYTLNCYRIEAVEAATLPWQSLSDTACAFPIHNAPTTPMNMITATVVNNQNVLVNWGQIVTPDPETVFLDRSTNNSNWVQLTTLAPNVVNYFDNTVDVNSESFYYRVSVLDSCGDITPISRVSRNIVLNIDNSFGELRLDWNAYEDWAGGIREYQIEIRREDASFWQLVTTVPGTATSFIDNLSQFEAAVYCYRVRAIEDGGNGANSLSNEVCAPPNIWIPNTITPNGDGDNDFFVIPALDNFPNNEIQIFNRWGNLIYEETGYQNDWGGTNSRSGASLPDGAYFYILKVEELGETYKGYVMILR